MIVVSRSISLRGSVRPIRQALVAWWVAAAVLLGAAPAAAQSGGAPGSQIINVARVSYQDANGNTATVDATAVVTIGGVRVAIEFTPNREAVVAAGGNHVFAHRLTNLGSHEDRFALSITSPPGWTVELFNDLDGDGSLGPGDIMLSEVTLPNGNFASILVRVTPPADAAADVVGTVLIEATSRREPGTSAFVQDRISVARPSAELFLSKTVDRQDAAAGDTVQYSLVARNQGGAASPAATLTDTLPRGITLVPGTLRVDGAPRAVTPVRTADGRDIVVVALGALPAGGRIDISFHAAIGDATGETARNVAQLVVGGEAVNSGPADVRLATPNLQLRKDVLGSSTLLVGDTVAYRIHYRNASPISRARALVLTDTLPAELELVRAPGADVSGAVLRWFLPELAPLDSGSVTLVARVLRRPIAGEVVNVAVLEGGAARVAVARAIALDIQEGDSPLQILKSAAVLEVGAGEAIPYSVRLRNQGTQSLHDVVVEDRLPQGVRLIGTPVGADSMRVDGGLARFFVTSSLAPGATVTLRYAVVLVQPGRATTLRNVATAIANGGSIRSDSATADVRTRGFEVQGRTVVGKVYLDENDNGRQDAHEKGVGGVSVWGADGEVVTTDSEGRFSFRDVLPGTHVFRLDTLSLPGGARVRRANEMVQMLRTDGWTMPRLNFALRPGVAGAASARLAGGDDAPAVQAGAPANGAARVDSVRVPALRSSQEREREASQAFATGVPVRIFAPADGAVIWSNRLFVGVRGEPGMPVRLYDGDSLIAQGVMRADGVHDFIGIDVAPGPHRFRAWMRNSMGGERWDSVAVHHAARADSLVAPAATTTLRTDVRGETPVRVRVLDRFGVPVAQGTNVTVAAVGVVIEGSDTDLTSQGEQRTVGRDGWLELPVRGARQPGPGRITVVAERASVEVDVRTLPTIHPLVAVGAAQIALAGSGSGVGGTFGALTMRGAIDDETALSVSYDSRRTTDDDRRLFGRDIDPLDGARFPMVGDGSERRVLAPATGSFAARVERGFDWVEFGDVRPSGFAGDGRLLAYERSVTGMNGRVATGDLTWQAFGTLTAQRLEQRQMRALGSAGPFLLGAQIRPGTERVFVEVRARENAARVLDRRELQRVTDYEISYETGALLLRRALPASDVGDNPVFVVALVERRGAGERKLVGGLRAELDAGRRLGFGSRSGLTIGASVVRDEAGMMPEGTVAPGVPLDVRPSGVSIVGADAQLRRGGLEGQLELLRAEVADSTAIAGRAEVRWRSENERMGLDARWMRVGQGFGASLDPRLSNAVDELSLAASMKVGDSAMAELSHRRERFDQYGVERSITSARTEQRLGRSNFSQEFGVASDQLTLGLDQRTGTAAIGRLRLAHGDDRSLWLEGARVLESTGGASPQPDRIAAGASWQLLRIATAELKHEWVSPTDAAAYQMTGLRLRGAAPFGRVWGGLDRADAVRATNSAVLGVEQRLRFAKIWSIESGFERRMGLGGAPLNDPLRAMPFAGPEPDYWTAAFGAAVLPGQDLPHATLRLEHRDAVDEATTRLSLAADASMGAGGALLLRSDWRSTERGEALASVAGRLSRDDRSVLGLAMRPTNSDLFDMLAKLEWRRTMNPLGGSTFADSTEYRRLIGAADAVWSATRGTELALRYALRWSAWQDGDAALPAPFAQFGGARLERALVGRLSARLDGRVLYEQATTTARWSAAPSLLMRLTPALHVEAGHRFGDLLDVDFGNPGDDTGRFFATIGVRFTERLLTTPASFWRDRLQEAR